MNKKLWLCAAVVALSVACGDEDPKKSDPVIVIEDMAQDQDSADQAADQASAPDAAPDLPVSPEDMAEDLPTFGDDLSLPDSGDDCDEQAVVTREWPLHSKVSAGAVMVTSANGVFTATIDAAAGGSMQARNNAFVYLDLDNGGAKVAVTDIDAFADTSWELAFRRTALRSNSGDSGPGAVLLAKELETTFDAVTAAPPLDDASAWKTDTTLDEQCMVQLDPIGVPMAAVNFLNLFNPSGSRSWYQYAGGGGAGGVEPTPGDIYFVKSATSNTVYKLEIQSWVSGVYTIRWAPLP